MPEHQNLNLKLSKRYESDFTTQNISDSKSADKIFGKTYLNHESQIIWEEYTNLPQISKINPHLKMGMKNTMKNLIIAKSYWGFDDKRYP